MLSWEDIERFDETNAEHRGALKEWCLLGGRTISALYKERGWTPSNLNTSADAFACNMSALDARFPAELLHLKVGGSKYWWKWVQQMAAWWLEGYHQAEAND